MYSTDPRQQPCAGGGRRTVAGCAKCLFTDRCLADTLELEQLMGQPRAGIWAGLTEIQRIHLATQ